MFTSTNRTPWAHLGGSPKCSCQLRLGRGDEARGNFRVLVKGFGGAMGQQKHEVIGKRGQGKRDKFGTQERGDT